MEKVSKIIKVILTILFAVGALFFVMAFVAITDFAAKIICSVFAVTFIIGIIILNIKFKNIPTASSVYELENKIFELNQHNNELANEVARLNQYSNELNCKISELNHCNDELSNRLASLNQNDTELSSKTVELTQNNLELTNKIAELKQKLDSIGYPNYETARNLIQEKELELTELKNKIRINNSDIAVLNSKIVELTDKKIDLERKIIPQTKKLQQIKELYNSISYSINNYYTNFSSTNIGYQNMEEIENLAPSVILKLHHMDAKDLRKAFNENNKLIARTFNQYETRYTNKASKSIYQLLGTALKAELQNVLYDLKYEKLDKSIDSIKIITSKYLHIAGEGNQGMLSTLVRFIGEIEYLFINAIKIEYNYYVKREQQKQEQAALRERMKQEAEERSALEAERQKIEQEEQKFSTEIEKLQTSIPNASNQDELAALKARISELQAQLSNIVVKKDDIVKLQNGKAGSVYIISNLGSFGDDIFKIGMTRRLDPQDRVNELGSASVPFKFDVHSFIFSDNAVELESSLHQRLNNNRVNKVNHRKEFFKVSIDELEKLVAEIDPTAEFTRTMLAEEYNQSLSTDEVYDNSETNVYDEENDYSEDTELVNI